MEQWQKDAVVYQIYPMSFQDANGDGIGDLAGILRRVPYLASLGINTVWLSPCFPSPRDDNGYDISDYRDIAPEYGTLAQFKELLEALHAKGIRLLLDLVVNHTSDEHIWFQKSRESRESPYRDYYIWRDAVNGHEPNEWKSNFGGSAWEWDENTGQYYLHLFSNTQPDLNWDNPAVRREIAEMINYWLDMGVDGFRCDVINSISKDFSAPQGGGNGPHLHEYLHELYERAFHPHHALTIGETWGLTPAQALELTGRQRGELSAAFQFEHLLLGRRGGDKWRKEPFSMHEFVAILDKWQRGLAKDGYPVLVMENHDQPRALSRFGDSAYPFESASMLAVLLYGQRGIPVIYQGQELGLANPVFSDLAQFRDIETLNARKELQEEYDDAALLSMLSFGSRDNARVPMPWDAEKGRGFTSGRAWIPVENDPARSVAAEEKDKHSMLWFYRRLFSLRRENAALRGGDFTLLHNAGGYCLYRREADAKTVFVLCNLTAKEIPMPPQAQAAQCLLSNYALAQGAMLRPYEALIFEMSEK